MQGRQILSICASLTCYVSCLVDSCAQLICCSSCLNFCPLLLALHLRELVIPEESVLSHLVQCAIHPVLIIREPPDAREQLRRVALPVRRIPDPDILRLICVLHRHELATLTRHLHFHLTVLQCVNHHHHSFFPAQSAVANTSGLHLITPARCFIPGKSSHEASSASYMPSLTIPEKHFRLKSSFL